jgi:rRNA maturation protein Rpf1
VPRRSRVRLVDAKFCNMKVTEVIQLSDSRENFSTTWLTEMPEGIGSFELIDALTYNLRDRVTQDPDSVVQLANGLKKIEGTQVIYYWFEDKEGNVTLVGEFEKAPQALIVRGVGKIRKGKPPFASDLYNLVLQDRKQMPGQIDAIRLMSDTTLSDEGFKLWSKMIAQGHKIMAYDKQNPSQFQDISSTEDLAKFFKNDDTSFRRYQYVLSESTHYGEVRSHFNTRKMREAHNML